MMQEPSYAKCATKNGTNSSHGSNISMSQHNSQEEGVPGDEPRKTFRRMNDRMNEIVKNPLIEARLRQTPGYVERLEHDTSHPEAATEFIDCKESDDCELQPERNEQFDPSHLLASDETKPSMTEILEQQREERIGHVLNYVRNDVWPLLREHKPISKHEHEDILGYDPESGV
jgi:hypothetical protein